MSSNSTKVVAAVQMNSTDKVEQNLSRIEVWVQKAKAMGSELVVLPENCAFIGKNDFDKLAIAEKPGQGDIQNALAQMARQNNLWLVGGTIPILANSVDSVDSVNSVDSVDSHANKSHPQIFNRCYVWNNQGQVVAHYDKIHLFDVEVSEKLGEKLSETIYRESDTFVPGKEIISVESPVGKLGLSVCYDLRFPELYRNLLQQNAEILLIPSAFTATTGLAHWEILLRARAIENLCYVVAAGQTGRHVNGRSSFGSSMIIDPWGKILNRLETEEGIITDKIDLSYLKEIRSRFPATTHRKIF